MGTLSLASAIRMWDPHYCHEWRRVPLGKESRLFTSLCTFYTPSGVYIDQPTKRSQDQLFRTSQPCFCYWLNYQQKVASL